MRFWVPLLRLWLFCPCLVIVYLWFLLFTHVSLFYCFWLEIQSLWCIFCLPNVPSRTCVHPHFLRLRWGIALYYIEIDILIFVVEHHWYYPGIYWFPTKKSLLRFSSKNKSFAFCMGALSSSCPEYSMTSPEDSVYCPSNEMLRFFIPRTTCIDLLASYKVLAFHVSIFSNFSVLRMSFPCVLAPRPTWRARYYIRLARTAELLRGPCDWPFTCREPAQQY